LLLQASKGAEAVKDALVDTEDRLKEAAAETGEAIMHGVKAAGENVKEGVDEAQGPRADSGVHVRKRLTSAATGTRHRDFKHVAQW
jgi:hypothetical protein